MPEIDLGYVLGPKGDPGEPGRDGTDGTPGAPGAPGTDGKSAYQYAKEGGFVGTEEQFYTALAEVVLKMNKVIPRKVDTIATLSAAGQAQDSGKTLAEFATAEQIKNVYTKNEADGKFAGRDAFYTKDETMTTTTGQLFGERVTNPNEAFAAIKTLLDAVQNPARIVQGSYVGIDELTKTIDFGFVPKFVLILKMENDSMTSYYAGENLLLWAGQTKLKTDYNATISVSGTSIVMSTVKSDAGHANWIYSKYVLNSKGATYRYVGVG